MSLVGRKRLHWAENSVSQLLFLSIETKNLWGDNVWTSRSSLHLLLVEDKFCDQTLSTVCSFS